MKSIVLDSAPLGTLTHRFGIAEADACREWLAAKFRGNDQVIIPEIIDYELRRELIRLGKTASLRRLDRLITHPKVTFLPITSAALRLAAELWAQVRQVGRPTADVHALDVDVIMIAQVRSASGLSSDMTVATSNASHISLFLPAASWTNL
jgi:predicted nucleic acid-binding protein